MAVASAGFAGFTVALFALALAGVVSLCRLRASGCFWPMPAWG